MPPFVGLHAYDRMGGMESEDRRSEPAGVATVAVGYKGGWRAGGSSV